MSKQDLSDKYGFKLDEVELLERLVIAGTSPMAEQLRDYGKKAFELQSVHGLPVDITISEYRKTGLTEDDLLVVLSEYQHQMIEHKRLAGAEEKNIEKQRVKNRRDLIRFLEQGGIEL